MVTHNDNLDEHRNNIVKIIINGEDRDIHRGRRTVIEIKTIGKIPLNHMLEQLLNGKLTPLDDDGSVVIKGEEKFISHPKDGGSS